MSKTNLQKLHATRAGIRANISMLIESAENAKIETDVEEFRLALEELEITTKTLLELNEKILSATDAEHTEEEIVTTGADSFRLKKKLSGLRSFRNELDAKDANKNRNAQDERCGDGFERQAVRDGTNSVRGEVSGDESSAAGIQCEGTRTGNTSVDIASGLQQQRMVNSGSGTQHATGNVSFTSFHSANYSRLPKLTLPMFDGDVQTWQSFWDSFESTVHHNSNLTDVQRFSYLKNQLVGEAARTIDGFALTHINYARAIELLRERYGQRHKIVHATMQTLIQLPAPMNTLYSLRKFYDEMETKIRALESLGKPQESYGDVLVPIVLDKLPGEIREHLARQHGADDWLLSDLRSAIFREISIKEAGASSIALRPETELYGTAASLYAGARNSSDSKTQSLGDKQTLNCLLCGDSHVVSKCPKYPDVDSKLKVVKEKKLCFNCFRKHAVFSCKNKKRCQRCGKKHHTTICKTNMNDTPNNRTPGFQPQQSREAAVLYTSARQSRAGVLLKTAVTDVCYRDNMSSAAVLFDEGAQRSFITETLANQLQLPRQSTETVSLSAFGGSSEKFQHIDTSTVYVVTEQQKKIPVRVLIVPTIATPIDISHRSDITKLTYLKGLKLAHPISDASEFPISLLIGADYYWDFIQDKIIRGNGPTAVKSKLGYLLSGPFNSATQRRSTEHILNVMVSRSRTEESIEKFWNLESLGIMKDEPNSKLEQELEQYQKTSVEFQDGRYTARLPWRPDHPELPTNFNIVTKRTESTVRRLAKKPKMLKTYDEIIEEQERRGFIEKVPDTEIDTQAKQVHYIPHHPVKKDSSTTPIRIVYDCSCRATSESPSLNDCLQSTPPVLNELTSILLRFRLHKYAVTTDIEKAFLNVNLHPDDRDVTRFLWLRDPCDPHSNFMTYRFRSVLFGATSSPFILNAVILKHLETNPSIPASEILRRDLYVDNVISSFHDDSECLQYYSESRALMSSAGMNLRSWNSNNEKLVQLAKENNVLDKDDITKVLGLRWDPTDDVLSFAKREIPIVSNVTKRLILKHSSQIYDPLGLLSPVTVRAKLMMQEIWKQKVDWDTPLPDDLQKEWNCLATDLNTATQISFPRQYLSKSPNKDDHKHLHIFVDASMMSYGAAVYVCDKEESRLVMAKNRVAPLKTLTLPKLELMAALIGARLADHVQTTFSTSHVTMWSDSQIVLHWIATQKVLPRFVANRVKEIKDLTSQHKWKYCPTKDNPADLLTRGITADNFNKNDLWMTGPEWLCDRSRWPMWEFSENLHVQIMLEEPSVTQMVVTDQTARSKPEENVQNIINVEKFSRLSKLLRVTAYVMRFIKNCKAKRRNANLDPLTATELEQTQLLWIRSCQATNYKDEIQDLKTNKPQSSLTKQLKLFLDNGAIRCGGRIHNATVDDATKFPYLLPKKHPLTRLVVQASHELQGHSGLNATVTCIRQKFWIPAIRQCVNAVIRKCVVCRKVQGSSYKSPEMPPLPKLRVTDAPPFTVTGVDFSGALYIKSPTGTDAKAYVCLFTCASTRAVHLEVVTSLSTDCFLQAFRRFSSRKSMPQLMVSDNAKTFQKASTYLKTMFESQRVRDHLANAGVEWKFIPERAPWYGGWWERLIGLTKQTLKKVLGRAKVDLETLQTVVTEAESILNDRPLTYVSSSLDDPEPLTPAHLMCGRKIRSLPLTIADINRGAVLVDRSEISRRVEGQSRLIDSFWTRWKTEYLTALRERSGKPGSNSQTIRVGEVVQVHDESPRIRWKLAVVESLIYGNDGLVRAAKIKFANGLYATRPIVKLYPLEVIDS